MSAALLGSRIPLVSVGAEGVAPATATLKMKTSESVETSEVNTCAKPFSSARRGLWRPTARDGLAVQRIALGLKPLCILADRGR